MKPATSAGAWRLTAAALTPAAGLTCAGLAATQDPDLVNHWWWAVPAVLLLIGSAGVVGFLIVRRQPGNVIGWLLLAHALFVGIGLSVPPPRPVGPFETAVAQAGAGTWVLLYACLVLIGYLFPDGRLLSRRWRTWMWFCLAGYVVFLLGAAWDVTDFRERHPGLEPPLPAVPPGIAGAATVVGLAVVAASLLGTVVCARTRLRRATGDERLRMLWFTWAAVSVPGMLAVCLVDIAITGAAGAFTLLGITVLGTVIPVVIGIAILRYRLFDIELVLSRTLIYGALTVGVVGTYALVLAAADRLFGDRPVGGLLGVGLVAVAVQPAHAFLRRRVERWVYGERSDPVGALRRLSDRVEQTVDPALVVQTVTESVAEALRVDRVWVELPHDEAAPDAGDRTVRVPLSRRGERLGALAVEVPSGRQFTPADRSLLDGLARHAAVVVDAVHLTLDLQRSRARLVTAREEERRRLRRDLHDGVGPSLAAIVLKLGTAESRRDAEQRNRLLAEVREETRTAIAEVRRLVDDLRPPAIDEVGLLDAIRQRVGALAGPRLTVELTSSAEMPPLPAAVEVAAFRIATEAVTNVSRHSGATRCVVHLDVDRAFELTVTDNGRGAQPDATSGVGLTSMAERATELGGSCTVSRRAEGGTIVRAILPLPVTPRSGTLS